MTALATRIALAALVAAAPAAASASMVCAERAELLGGLARNYGEHPAALGLTWDGQALEVLASASGSWTLLVTTPQGISCVVSAGEAWQLLPPPPKGTGS